MKLLKLPFHHSAPQRALRKPVPSPLPKLQTGDVAASYRAARVGGDFYDFQLLENRLIFVLADIAGKRDEALDIAAALQQTFHGAVTRIAQADHSNVAEVLSDLAIALNRSVMEAAGGVRCAPAFIGSYDEEWGTLFYVNAGHIPALLKDRDGVSVLGANGLPLGLFSHATHDTQTFVMQSGAAVVLASKGLVESKARRQEFGFERLRESVEKSQFSNANELCAGVLKSVEEFTKNTAGQNDITAVALMRSQVAVPALAGA